MEKIIEYRLLTGADPAEMEKEVKDFLEKGFQPMGPPYIQMDPGFRNGFGKYAQAMVKHGDYINYDPKSVSDQLKGRSCHNCGDKVAENWDYDNGVFLQNCMANVFCGGKCFEEWAAKTCEHFSQEQIDEAVELSLKNLEEERAGLEDEYRERVSQATKEEKERLLKLETEFKSELPKLRQLVQEATDERDKLFHAAKSYKLGNVEIDGLPVDTDLLTLPEDIEETENFKGFQDSKFGEIVRGGTPETVSGYFVPDDLREAFAVMANSTEEKPVVSVVKNKVLEDSPYWTKLRDVSEFLFSDEGKDYNCVYFDKDDRAFRTCLYNDKESILQKEFGGDYSNQISLLEDWTIEQKLDKIRDYMPEKGMMIYGKSNESLYFYERDSEVKEKKPENFEGAFKVLATEKKLDGYIYLTKNKYWTFDYSILFLNDLMTDHYHVIFSDYLVPPSEIEWKDSAIIIYNEAKKWNASLVKMVNHEDGYLFKFYKKRKDK